MVLIQIKLNKKTNKIVAVHQAKKGIIRKTDAVIDIINQFNKNIE